MCGINGILSIKKGNNEHIVRVMNNALKHRGPDDEGVYSDECWTIILVYIAIYDGLWR